MCCSDTLTRGLLGDVSPVQNHLHSLKQPAAPQESVCMVTALDDTVHCLYLVKSFVSKVTALDDTVHCLYLVKSFVSNHQKLLCLTLVMQIKAVGAHQQWWC